MSNTVSKVVIDKALVADLATLRTELNFWFPEREDAIEAIFLAILSKEHVFVLGPPGTAKSLLIRTVITAVLGASYFECAMSKQRSAEAILGPIDMLEFRTSGHQWRKNKGFITDVNFAFVDEIGKMSPIMGHDLLALFNERIRHEVNGQLSAHPTPLYSAFTASNEMLTDDSDDAAAMWDRLLVRVFVDDIKDDKNFVKLLTQGEIVVKATVDWSALADAIDNQVPNIVMDKAAMKGIVTLRKKLQAEHIYPSGRRWKASMKALKAKAYMEGRDTVYEEDLAVLRFTLWDTVPQMEKIERLCTAASNPFVDRVHQAIKEVTDLMFEMDKRKDKNTQEKSMYAKEANAKLKVVRTNLDALYDEANGRNIPKFKQAADLHRGALIQMYTEVLGQSMEVAEKQVEKKVGKGDGGMPT